MLLFTDTVRVRHQLLLGEATASGIVKGFWIVQDAAAELSTVVDHLEGFYMPESLGKLHSKR